MNNLKPEIHSKDIIVKSAADFFLPFALVYGFYIIFHGNVSPGGGFQGGVIVASAVVLLYLGYGYKKTSSVISARVSEKTESIASLCYIILAFSGIFWGANFFRNIFFETGAIGEILSAGNIAFMNHAVGYKVMAGISFLLLLFLDLSDHKNEEKAENNDEESF